MQLLQAMEHGVAKEGLCSTDPQALSRPGSEWGFSVWNVACPSLEGELSLSEAESLVHLSQSSVSRNEVSKPLKTKINCTTITSKQVCTYSLAEVKYQAGEKWDLLCVLDSPLPCSFLIAPFLLAFLLLLLSPHTPEFSLLPFCLLLLSPFTSLLPLQPPHLSVGKIYLSGNVEWDSAPFVPSYLTPSLPFPPLPSPLLPFSFLYLSFCYLCSGNSKACLTKTYIPLAKQEGTHQEGAIGRRQTWHSGGRWGPCQHQRLNIIWVASFSFLVLFSRAVCPDWLCLLINFRQESGWFNRNRLTVRATCALSLSRLASECGKCGLEHRLNQSKRGLRLLTNRKVRSVQWTSACVGEGTSGVR